MTARFLYEHLDSASQLELLQKEIPASLTDNLNPKFELRPYQEEAFARFFHCFANAGKTAPLHLLFNMATGSGKTLIMAGAILWLYERGYRNFLFFVNSTNIIEKTRDNFLNPLSSKYLFREDIRLDSQRVAVTPVVNFEGVNEHDINICFTTIQKLHADLTIEKENALTYEDFKDKKIVLLADEAHHMNVSTRRNLLESWENTVERIFVQNTDNVLLEFTATLDYTHKNIVEKYRNKVLYKYDLRQFRNDGYSKDVYIVQADFEEKDRIIQALILNQYKQEVAAKHRINLKPVMLFKAQRTIAQSRENKANFHRIVENLSPEDILRIRDRSDLPLVKQAYQFFECNQITPSHLAARLRREFDQSRCISVNEEKEKENQQILLNSLEDQENRIRAIFAVQKLNEGWDVLNLFDIVRCYTTRDAKAGKPGKTTIAEAQLIGRGARYFPFVTDVQEERYLRKFDRNLTAELRVLEELHYHSMNDSRYISELRSALVEEGLLDEREVNKTLTLKDSFKETEFYKNGLLYLNKRVINRYEHVRSLADMGISAQNYQHTLASGRGAMEAILGGQGQGSRIAEAGRTDVAVREIPIHIVRNAMARNPFFSFSSLQTYFPHIQSLREFITEEAYLGGLAITFFGTRNFDREIVGTMTKFSVPNQGTRSERCGLSNRAYYDAMTGLLAHIEAALRQTSSEYRGAEKFSLASISSVFTDKSLKLVQGSERSDGDEEFVASRDWYVFNANYGTSEEKAFVRMLDRQIERLQEKYDKIYLFRNERHFKIYNFEDGQAFEPDFILFLREKDRDTYQMFVESKGEHLQEHDRWKEVFLEQLTDRFKGQPLEFQTQTYRLVGAPFYNSQDENAFLESLFWHEK